MREKNRASQVLGNMLLHLSLVTVARGDLVTVTDTRPYGASSWGNVLERAGAMKTRRECVRDTNTSTDIMYARDISCLVTF